MNTSMRTIAYMGIFTILGLAMLSTMSIRQSPKVRALLQLSESIRTIYNLESAYVSQLQIPQGSAYKIVFSPKQPTSSSEVDSLISAIGEHVWRMHPPDQPQPVKIIVLCKMKNGAIEREVKKPMVKW